jgi:hypothetical protein
MADRGQQIRYYRPYDSSDESGSDSESESDESWYNQGFDQHQAPPGQLEGHPNFRAFASQIQLVDAAGRGFSTIRDELAYSADQLGRNTDYSAYEPLPPETQEANISGNSETTTTLILIDSRYRDRVAYPQPTDFSLRLPRVYKNITNITLSDVKLLTSFYFFRLTKGNTDITVYEKGRTTLTYEGTTQSTIVKRFIQEGSYNIDQLLNEIQVQLNYTPLFRDYPNGFNDFVTAFRASGDYFLNFNYPGDYYYDNITNQWIPNPTIDTIVQQYWASRFAGLTSYTANQILIAYYYPVINEYLFDEEYINQPLNLQVGIGINPLVTTVEDVRNYLKYDFLGINPPDPICLAVINANQSLLDKYRLEHTFRYWLINKYVVSRDTRSQNVYIASPSLNTSLIRFITAQQTQYFNQALNVYGLTRTQYSNLVTQTNRALAVLSAMYNVLQQNFLTYFAVPWSQYTLDYYAHLDWQIYIQNGIGALVPASNDASALSQGIISYSNNILTELSSNPPYYWPHMQNLPQSTISYINLSSATSTFNLVYDMTASNFLSNHTIVEAPQDYIYSEYLSKEANAVCPIESGKYTVFKFHSPVRQTLQVETLPRPSVYRLPAYNLANFGCTINQYYDLSYAYRFTSNYPYAPSYPSYEMAYDNLPSSLLIQVPGWSNANALSNDANYSFGRTQAQSVPYYTSSLLVDVINFNRALYTTFTSPEYPGSDPNCNYTYQMNVSVLFYSTFTNTTRLIPPANTFRMFFYHDRGGFQGDVSGVRNENQKFYKFSTVIQTTDTSGTIQFTAYPKQQYFISLRPDDVNFGSALVRVLPWFSTNILSTTQTKSIAGINPQTDICGVNFPQQIASNFNYAQVYDSNFIRLPIQSNLWPPDPANNSNNQYLTLSNTPIGYDSNNVSTDYTDYLPYIINSYEFSFSPNCNFAIDPITKYNFQSNSPYDSTAQVFIDGGSNAIFQPGIGSIYTPAQVANRQYKISHYYSVNYIPESQCNFPLPPNAISAFSTAQLPYTVSTTQNTPIQGYQYGTTESNIQLGYGVLGFSFIPDEGVWDVPRLMFRSAIQDSNTDPNREIQYVGIFKLGDIINYNTNQISLSSARIVLSNSARVYYTSTFIASNAGFDLKGGAYYEFKKDTGYVAPNYSNILGYTQTPAQMSDQPESMYTAITFSQYGLPLTIKALSGSVVPYPFYNEVFVSSAYLDGTKAYNSTQGVVFPSTIDSAWPFISSGTEYQYGPPSTFFGVPTSETQSRTVLSQPIGTTVLAVKSTLAEVIDSNMLWPWTTTLTPTLVLGTVSNYLLTQDTQYSVYSIQQNSPTRILSTPIWQVSADQIFPSYENTSLVGVAGNSSDYYFLGFSNSNAANTDFSLRMKRFSPTTGVLSDYPLDSTFNVPIGGTLKSFTMNDHEQMVMSYQNTTNITSLYLNTTPSTTMTTYLSLTAPSTMVHTMDPTTSTIYYLPLNGTTNLGVGVYRAITTGSAPGTLYTPTGTSLPSGWTNLAVTAASNVPTPGNDYVYLYSLQTGYESNVYYSSNWTTGPNTFQMQRVNTQITTTAGTGQSITSLTGGSRGGLWITAGSSYNIWGTRNSEVDISAPITTAWQIFYPFQKIVLEKVAQIYNPITDLTFLNYPEYPHTAMFYYSNETKYNNDTKHKWGLENNSNFLVGDGSMQGYYFNSYVFNAPLRASSNTDYQYLTVRSYSPTETSETLIRFVLPNKLDFGYVTQNDLITEISTLNQTPLLYNSNYAFCLSNFDTAFQQSNSFFGQGLLPDFNGSNFNSSNFAQFASNYSTIYGGYTSNSALLSNITFYVDSNVQYFISTQLVYIIPPDAQGRQNYTDPIIFSLLWRTGLLPQYAQLLEDWGLGYNLGYAKRDTPFSTYHRAESFYKILDDYIYLRMNQEFSLNRMDTTNKENFNRTRDSTGSVQNFHGKLILNNFNTYSTTFIYNNRPLNPAIGKLETMYFNWVNFIGEIIDNNDCDWTASLVITESKIVKDLAIKDVPGGFGALIRNQEGGGPLRSQGTAAEVAQAGRAPTGGRGARAGAGLG